MADQRRPSASLRTRRPSTVYQEGDNTEPAPAVPAVPNSHLNAYYGSGQPPPSRPPARNAKSSDTDTRTGGRNRAGTGNSGNNAASGVDSSKVGAYLLNKRQSVSFGKAMGGQQRAMVRDAADGIPVPSLPTGGSGGQRPAQGSIKRNTEASAGEEMIARGPRGPAGQALTDLLKEDFNPDTFLQLQLSGSSSGNAARQLDDMRKLKSALNQVFDHARGSLQTNVIKNYQEFIRVSKDISALETEMMELKGVLEEWKTVPEGLEIEQTFDQNAGSGRNRRNSLADLQALYKTQLEALWDSVEGAQRFSPVVPGRHILGRHPNWIELNSATYRPRQSVILVLLNDALLVAVEKRRQMGGAIKVVADKCFHLNEIAVTDLKDTGGLTNAIRVKRDREVSIFRTEKPEDKRQLLSAFKKILEETLSRRRKESVWEAEHRRDTIYGGSRNNNANNGAPLSNHPLASFQPSRIFPFVTSHDTSGKDLGWIDDVADQLAVHIALREFEEAVTLIEKAKSILPEVDADQFASQLLRSKIDTRSEELSSVLLTGLADTSIRKTGVVKNSGWLLRLGQGDRARETFLTGRGELMKSRTGEISFTSQGNGTDPLVAQNMVTEVAQLAFVCFTLIRNTCEWYMAAYKDHQAASAFVRWASEQVEAFASTFKRQVYAAQGTSPQVLQACLDTATTQAAMLKEVGLDFAFLLSTRLKP